MARPIKSYEVDVEMTVTVKVHVIASTLPEAEGLGMQKAKQFIEGLDYKSMAAPRLHKDSKAYFKSFHSGTSARTRK